MNNEKQVLYFTDYNILTGFKTDYFIAGSEAPVKFRGN